MRFQFKIRTLAIATVCVAVFCAVVIHWVTLGKEQANLLNDLRKGGISVGYKGSPRSIQYKLASLFGIDMIVRPGALICNSPRNEPVDMEKLVRVQSVEHLAFNCTGIQNEDLKLLHRMPSLKYLNLTSTDITDEGIANLIGCQLTTLHASDLNISDSSLDSIAKITTLKLLNVSKGKLSEEAIARLSEKLPSCEIRAE